MNIQNLRADIVPGFEGLTNLKAKHRDVERRKKESDDRVFQLTQEKIASGNVNLTASENVQRVINNQDVSIDNDLDSLLRKETANNNALADASHLLSRQIADETRKAGRKICDDVKPQHDAIRIALNEALAAAYSANSKYWNLRKSLIDSGAGLHGICLNAPEFLGVPSQRTSGLAEYLLAEKKAGYLKRLPKELA
ncbi:hypothetical protein QA645_16995 [Bradyrhizobium sp. CIAT3101]|uniref:hypothetical protein n=1 Tax=Bradyrhizobium sp. CIAT3101 TaxID=439387 RepID=UPI0024B19EFE|nr:hypothetical protein [Bradyrhizobium sp. CIAT3101]WFU84369.1 hypothetical protein QA645_16995 [Bradyrhizobium sp. CIAT3101]